MKTITATELQNILASHKLFLDGKGGERADLYHANLKGANLSYADLRGADLINTDLRGANLEGADLGGAVLTGANLHAAYLRDANLGGAVLKGANLSYADLKDANLWDANLKDANLTGTILDKKAEKQPEVVSVNAESTIRSEIEAIAKKHGMKVDSIALSFL